MQLRKDILAYAHSRLEETGDSKYNVFYLTQIPTWLAIDYLDIDLDQLAKAVIRDNKVARSAVPEGVM